MNREQKGERYKDKQRLHWKHIKVDSKRYTLKGGHYKKLSPGIFSDFS